MQKFPLRNRQRKSLISPRPTNRIASDCRGISAVTTRLTSATKPPSVRICSRVLAHEDMVTWDEVLNVGGKNKSWQSHASSSPVESSTTTATAAAAAVTTQRRPVQQQTSANIEVPCNAVNNTNTNGYGNRNKDDDDNNRRNFRIIATPRRRPGTGTGAGAKATAAAASEATPAGASSAREFTTFEQLKLGDQINLLLFDPYRTLKFLITELKSRLRVVAPDDINAHKILVEIQQAVKRIRASNAANPTTTRTTAVPGRAAVPAAAKQPIAARPPAAQPTEGRQPPMAVGWCIPPGERCHVIKEDPLINHARKVNSSCQTMESQLENVANACQMCEHQNVRQEDAAGCNQKRMNGNSNAEDVLVRMAMEMAMGVEMDEDAKLHQRSKDHKEGAEVEKRFNYNSLQDAIDILKSRINPFSKDTQRIITQLETELRDIQGKTPQLKSPGGIRSNRTENSKVQCKRRPNDEDTKRKETEGERPHHHDMEEEQEKETFPNFNANPSPTPSIEAKKLDSSTQAAADTTSKEAQTNLKNPTQLLCHLEREKFLVLQQFRSAEMQNIQGDLNELHVFIKDQLDGIYHSITRENLKAKYHLSGGRRSFRYKKTRQRTATTSAAPKAPLTAQPSSSTPSLTAQTSSALSSNELAVDQPATTPDSSTSTRQFDNLAPHPTSGYANITKSMMKQQRYKQKKLSSSSLSALDAKEDFHDIGDVDKANKTTGGKKSKGHHSRHHQLCDQHHHFSNAKCCARDALADTPHWSGKRIHYSAVECGDCCRCRHSRALTAELARTSIHCDAKSTTKTSLPAMTHHQHRQQCQHRPMTTATATTKSAAQEQTQLRPSSSSRAQPAAVVPPPRPQPYTFMATVPEERAELSRDGMTNATVRAVIPKPILADRPDGISCHRSLFHCQAKNTWQCVNPRNPACCQLKKQICGNVYEPRINKNNNIPGTSNDNDNHSNCPEIHDCQKCRANTVNWFCGLCSARVHEVGVDNSAPIPIPPAPAATLDGGAKGGGADDADAGGDGPIHRDFIFHIGQRTLRNLHSRPMTEAFQTDLDEFKEFLDEIILSTPRLK